MLPLPSTDPRRQAIEADVQESYDCIDLNFDTPEYLTTASRDVVLEGRTYLSTGAIIDSDVLAPQQNLSRDFYRLTFDSSDKTATGYGQKFKDATGVSMQLYTVFVVNNAPIIPYKPYKGTVYEVQDLVSNNGAVLLVTFSGPLSSLDNTKIFLTTDASQRRRDDDDDCFKYCHNTFNLRWGSVNLVANLTRDGHGVPRRRR